MGKTEIISVESSFDPNSKMVCCGEPTKQEQITQVLTLNGQEFRVLGVWASVCRRDPVDHVYFAPQVSNAITNEIFERQHPVESKIAKLLEQD